MRRGCLIYVAVLSIAALIASFVVFQTERHTDDMRLEP